MRSIIAAFISLILLIETDAQQTISIPELKNLNPSDKYPSNTFLSSYANQFDIVISLKGYSAWGPDYHIKMLAHHQSGWWKIEINTNERDFDFNTVCYSTSKINDTVGKIVWDTLLQYHLFDMKDERQSTEMCPPFIIDTVYYSQVTEIIVKGTSGSDMPEYEFEILTSKNYKKLYFYSPHEKYGYCSKTKELKWIVTCISVFEKYLGK